MANVLLFIDINALHIGTVRDHVESLKSHSGHSFYIADCRGAIEATVALDRFDVVAFHYSVIISRHDFISRQLADACSAFRGLKVLFIQDEYRWIDQTVRAIAALGINVLFSVVNRDLLNVIYSDPSINGVRKELTLTGYVPEELTNLDVPTFSARPIDVGYRGRKVPFWLGAFAQEKWQIGERFKVDAVALGLKIDIASDERSRLYRRGWIDFLTKSKAVLGTESGASICDFTGDIQRRVDQFVADNPGATFEEVRVHCLEGIDGRHIIHVISPRCFEAAALRTLMILYPGDYSGILEPWRHYVPLAKDHSNIEEVISVLRSPEQAQQIIDAAYREIACNSRYTFATFVKHFDAVVDEELNRPVFSEMSSRPLTFEKQLLERILRRQIIKRWLYMKFVVAPASLRFYLPTWLRLVLRSLAVRMKLLPQS